MSRCICLPAVWAVTWLVSCTTSFIVRAGRSVITAICRTLFVDAQARGLGVGATLIKTVESAARATGASRLYWLTKEDNRTARALYDKLAERSGFIQYRKLF